ARVGAAERRFAALAAATVARAGQALIVSDERVPEFLAPLPLEVVPMDPRRRAELRELGVKKIGQLAGLPGSAVAERLGPDGRRAWGLARGGKPARVRGRRPPAEIVEALEFPEAIGNELTEHDGQQLELLPAAGAELDVRLREGLRQVRASTGTGSVNQVVEVAPWSRIPEARALFVPRDD